METLDLAGYIGAAIATGGAAVVALVAQIRKRNAEGKAASIHMIATKGDLAKAHERIDTLAGRVDRTSASVDALRVQVVEGREENRENTERIESTLGELTRGQDQILAYVTKPPSCPPETGKES